MSEHGNPPEQTGPVEAGHDDATDRAKLDGIVEQTKQDLALGNVSDADEALRQRLADAGLDVDEQEYAALLAAVRG